MRDTYKCVRTLDPPSPWYMDLELRPGELRALGHVTAQWAVTEHLIREFTADMVAVAQIALPVEANSVSFRKRRRAWEEVGRIVFASKPNYLAKLLALSTRASQLANDRKNLVHGLIQWSPTNRHHLHVYNAAQTGSIPWRVNRKEIEAIARKISILNYDILAFPSGLPEIVPASPRIRGKPVRIDPALVAPVRLPNIPPTRKRQPRS